MTGLIKSDSTQASRSYSPARWPRRQTLRSKQLVARLVCASALFVLLMGGRSLTARPADGAPDVCNKRFDIVFLVDRSGSLAPRQVGATYSLMIQAIAKALRDPTVIPRDRSAAVAVITFDSQPTVRIPLTEITSARQAESLALNVDKLDCTNPGDCPVCGPIPATDFNLAILGAAQELEEHGRAEARRVIVISTEGGCTDPQCGRLASNHFRDTTGASEIDLVLLALDIERDCPAHQLVKAATISLMHLIAFQQPAGDPPQSLVSEIVSGDCNRPNGMCSDLDRIRQLNSFIEDVRRILRGHPTSHSVVVTTAADPPPNSPVIDNVFTLRQAIEKANAFGGNTTITFADNLPPIILRNPLPSLAAPDIEIAGCKDGDCARVTLDGSSIQGDQHADGLWISSNHCIVRGLTIQNCGGAGIKIRPASPCDAAGHNLIDKNTLFNNGVAGVLVLDPDPGQLALNGHNVGNTISENSIAGSPIPIDLSGDGITCNDAGDFDDGPNKLTNYLDQLSATVTPVDIVFSCGIDGPIANAPFVVEIFAVSSGPSPTGEIERFTPLISAMAPDPPAFLVTVKNPKISNIAGFSATVTDGAGNTSEMKPIHSARLDKSEIEFPTTDARKKPSNSFPSNVFRVTNDGCDQVNIKLASLSRVFPGPPPANVVDFNDSALFKITAVNGKPAVPGGSLFGETFTIEPGGKRQFQITLWPLIPSVITAGDELNRSPSGLFASDLLPDAITSDLVITQDSGSNLKLRLSASITTGVRLTDPDMPGKQPKICFTRTGDQFEIVFSIYDSNLDVNRAIYEFIDKSGKVVSTLSVGDPLTQVIKDRALLTGQSFTVEQTITGAAAFPDIVEVRVTVTDAGQNQSGPVAAMLSEQPCERAVRLSRINEMRALVLAPISMAAGRGGRRGTPRQDSSGLQQHASGAPRERRSR